MTQTPPRPKIEENATNENRAVQHQTAVVPQVRVTRNIKVTKTPFSLLIDKFYDISIRKKQTIVLFAAQLISISVLLVVGVIEISTSGREQLINQSDSELAATVINYQIKIDQMGFGFRGQSDNAAIIDAALIASKGRYLNSDLKADVKRILQNEIEVRQIEFATLVGTDGRIIVNANKDRTGEIFDPNGLVSKLINRGQNKQIKTSEIISWDELVKESPSLLSKLKPNEDALIRYTITPVTDPNNDKIIAVLIAGDVVDGKYEIPENTLKEFKGGYSAIYKKLNNDTISLVSSVNQDKDQKNLPLKDQKLIEIAINTPDKIVSTRGQVGKNIYTITALAIKNNDNKPVAVLVRGTPESALDEIRRNSLSKQGGVALIILAFNFLFISILGKIIANRIESLQLVTQQFADGKQSVRANIRGQDEIGKLANTFNELADNIVQKEDSLVQDARQVIFLQDITGARTVDEDDINTVFDKTLKKARRLLQVDRIVIYRFNADWSGYISHEAVDSSFPEALNQKIEDPCIPPDIRMAYINGRVVPTEDVFNAGFAPEHLALMERLQIKANLVVPIINQGQLFALLIAHHCLSTHKWTEQESNFMNQMAVRLGVILDRVGLIQSQIDATRRAEQLKEITLFIAAGLTRQDVLNLAVAEIRPAMDADRVLIYEFDESWKGTIIAESVIDGYPKALGASIADPCFAEKYVKQYKSGRIQATNDISQAGLTPCHLKQLEPFQVKASIVTPIIVRRKLIGLLIVHQCSAARKWEPGEIQLFSQLATQVGLGLERVQLVEAQKQSEQEQREAREKLQQRALELLVQVDPVSQGDLTIRAQVTEDEIGTIADSYNATIESLRKIVSQVQAVASEVTETTNTNEYDVNILLEEVSEQVENIALALDRIQAMSKSSSMVAQSAEQAEEALQKAQESVEKGDIAMNRTVKSILDIRSTVQDAAIQVKKLGDATQKISNVVSLISRFAAQTHLLALKASIEAARAGEEGQGFAVIANEVRNLASQSASASADIEKLVTSIQIDTKSVVTAMEEGTEQVIEGTKLVEETRQSLNKITAATVQINELVEVIAAAAFEQSENSEEVRDKMSDVARVAEKTTISVTKLSDSFRKLLLVAKQLETNVSKFKV